MKKYLIITFILTSIYTNTFAIENKIPEEILIYELNWLKNSVYYEPSRKFDNFVFKQEYKDACKTFYTTVVKREDIKNISKLNVYKILICYGDFRLVNNLINLNIIDDLETFDKRRDKTISTIEYQEILKVRSLAEASFLFHRYNFNNENWQLLELGTDWIYTKSFNTYADQIHTPDLLFDNDKSTTWRIKNLGDKDESTLFIASYMLKKNNIVKIFFNAESECYKPKDIKFSLLDNNDKDIITKKVSLQNISKYQTIELHMNRIKSMLSNSTNIKKLKIEILNYYKGSLPYCDISELRVIPIVD